MPLAGRSPGKDRDGGSGDQPPGRRLDLRIASLLMQIAGLLERIAAAAIAAVALFVTLSAVMRYAFGTPFAFSDELVGLLLAAGLFLALPWLSLSDRHVAITGVTDRLGARARLRTRRFARIAMAGFAIVFVFAILPEVTFNLDFNVRSESGGIPLWPWVAVLPSTMVLIAIIELFTVIRPRAVPPPNGHDGHGADESRTAASPPKRPADR